MKYNLQSISLGRTTRIVPSRTRETGRNLVEEALTLTKMSGPSEGDPHRPARSPDLPGCHCRVTGWGLTWREGRGRRVFSRWMVRGEWKDVVMGREERKMNGA